METHLMFADPDKRRPSFTLQYHRPVNMWKSRTQPCRLQACKGRVQKWRIPCLKNGAFPPLKKNDQHFPGLWGVWYAFHDCQSVPTDDFKININKTYSRLYCKKVIHYPSNYIAKKLFIIQAIDTYFITVVKTMLGNCDVYFYPMVFSVLQLFQ